MQKKYQFITLEFLMYGLSYLQNSPLKLHSFVGAVSPILPKPFIPMSNVNVCDDCDYTPHLPVSKKYLESSSQLPVANISGNIK